jgi:hypothetical protein
LNKPATLNRNDTHKSALEAFAPAVDMELDAGIRRYVLVLRSEGIDTYESCQGGQGHAFPEPTVRFHGNAHEGFRAYTIAMNYGLPVFSLRRTYLVNDGWLEGPWWEMTFRTTDQETPNQTDGGNVRT